MKDKVKESLAIWDRLARLAAIPILLFIVAIGILYWLDIKTVAENEELLTLFNLLFSSSMTLLVAYLAARSYLAEGSRALLLLGCSMLVIGLTTALVGPVGSNKNTQLTFHNIGVFIAGCFSLVSAVSASTDTDRRSQSNPSGSSVAKAYVGLAALIVLIAFAAMRNVLPPFLIPGRGPTMLRQTVLGAGILQFGVSALLFRLLYVRSRSGFLQWYSLGLTLYTVGLIGVWLTIPGTPLNWTSRSAQFLAGPYFLVAILTVGRSWQLSLQKKLRESEARYHNLFSAMTEGFALHEIICDEKGEPFDYRFLDINPAFERLTGLKREDVIGKTHNEILPDDDPRWVKEYGTVALTGKPVKFENYSPALKRHYEVFAYRPAPHQFAVLFMDITGRKEIEDALRKENAFSTAVLDTAGALIVVLDREGRITHFNRTCEELTGYSISEVEGRIFWEFLVPQEDLYGVRQAWEALHAGDLPSRHENKWVAKDGSCRLIEWSNTAIVDAEGKIEYIIGTGIDITERKQAEDALYESEARFRLALRNAPVSVAVQDLDLRYIWAYNQRTASSEKILGHLDSDIFTPEEAARLLAIKRRVIDENVEIANRCGSTDRADGSSSTFTSSPFATRPAG